MVCADILGVIHDHDFGSINIWRRVPAFYMTTLRCSSLGRILSCPGSRTLEARVAPRVGDDGAEGTYLHHLAHSRMIAELGARGELGQEPSRPASVKFSQWIADFYFNTVREMVPSDWSIEVEAALAYEYPASENFILSGHIDCMAINPDCTEVIFFDLKTGYDPVDVAEDNWQIFGYASLILTAYPGLQKITAYIVQPRNDEDEGFQRVSPPMVLKGERLAGLIPTLMQEVSRALSHSMELETGRKQCRWCPAVMQCPALRAEKDLMKITLTPEALARIEQTPSDSVLADWVVSMRTLRQPAADAEEMLKKRIEAAGFVDSGSGARITIKVEGGSYDFPDKPAYYRALREVMPDANEDKIATAFKFSVTATKDLIADVMGVKKTGKGAITAEGIFDARFRPLVKQGERRKLVFSE